jgi:adenylosuccinate lyase
MNKLDAISPVDGRYRRVTEPLAAYFSERALMRYRVVVEEEYLIFLSEHPGIGMRNLSGDEKGLVKKLYDVSEEDGQLIKDIEVKDHGTAEINSGKKTNHDVKAIEYYMKHRLKGTSLEDCLEWIHFRLTSEDVNNMAYALMLSDATGKVMIPAIDRVYKRIEEFAQMYKDVAILARTHGQPASPTTFGKEFHVFGSRLERQIAQLEGFRLLAKLNGATGNYNAHHAAYPDVDWVRFTKDFIERFNDGRLVKLVPNLITTQIEPHDTYAELFDIFKRINNILIDFNQDMWRYVSDDWLKQKPVEGEVGSSTMPHKVNPIDFENSEGNLGFANAMFEFFCRKLPVSRLQRDLSDSTVERNFGVAFAHSLIGYESAVKGMGKISVNEPEVARALADHPEVFAEAIQTVLRIEGAQKPYELLKDLTRGRKVSLDEMTSFVEGLDVDDKVKDRLRAVIASGYTGIASLLVNVK